MKQLISLMVSCLLFSAYAESSPGIIFNSVGPDKLHSISDTSLTGSNEVTPVFKMRLTNSKDQKVSILMINSVIEVIGYDGDELKIESKNYKPPPSQAEGLKPLYNSTQDNTKLGLSVVKDNSKIMITQASNGRFKYTVFLPYNVSLSFEELSDQGADLAISDLNGEIELKMARGNAFLVNVTGPLIANSTKGNLKVVFSNTKSTKPCAFSSIKGSIDLALSSQNQSNLKLRSVDGEIYTDFDIVMDGSANLPTITGGQTIHGKINGGGPELTVHTVNGNIFLRKRK